MSAYKTSIFNLISTNNLAIPDYQRPYKWTKRNIEELLTDISKAIEESQKYGDIYKYRIGTILIHNSHDDGKLYIVDGQQRIISVALVCLYLSPSFDPDIMTHRFSDGTSKQNIQENYRFIQQWFTLKGEKERKLFFKALKDIIEIIVITVEKEPEAFQLFDSQNSRGKPLYPHDLLKAYHLREMSSNLYEMEHAVKKWEDEEPNNIKELFSDYLFPIYNWCKKMKTDTFSDRYIDIFKGSNLKESYTYAMKAFKSSPIFQISDSFIAGHDFFKYVGHYIQTLSDIKKELQQNKDFSEIQGILNEKSNGLKYCKNLFFCALLSYYDRFHHFDKMAVFRLFTWSFMIRIDMQHLGYDTINKYAIGEYNNKYSNNLPVFSIISNARKHTDISNLTIECHKSEDNWKDLSKKLLELNKSHHEKL